MHSVCTQIIDLPRSLRFIISTENTGWGKTHSFLLINNVEKLPNEILKASRMSSL